MSAFGRKQTFANVAFRPKADTGLDDDTAVKTITGIYRVRLDNLKKISEEATGI